MQMSREYPYRNCSCWEWRQNKQYHTKKKQTKTKIEGLKAAAAVTATQTGHSKQWTWLQSPTYSRECRWCQVKLPTFHVYDLAPSLRTCWGDLLKSSAQIKSPVLPSAQLLYISTRFWRKRFFVKIKFSQSFLVLYGSGKSNILIFKVKWTQHQVEI